MATAMGSDELERAFIRSLHDRRFVNGKQPGRYLAR
jgi:hypothetical protein